MVNKNVGLAAGCNMVNLNKPSEMRCNTVIGCEFNLPRTKARLQYVELFFIFYYLSIFSFSKDVRQMNSVMAILPIGPL